MAEIGTDLYLAYESGYEAGKKDATQKGFSVKATKEELFAAVRLIKEHCLNYGNLSCGKFRHEPGCPLENFCYNGYMFDQLAPSEWPDPEEGGGEDA